MWATRDLSSGLDGRLPTDTERRPRASRASASDCVVHSPVAYCSNAQRTCGARSGSTSTSAIPLGCPGTGSRTLRYPIGARPGVPPTWALRVMPLSASVPLLRDSYSASVARMPCISMPAGVSSMFSLTEITVAPAARSSNSMLASSRRFRANLLILSKMT